MQTLETTSHSLNKMTGMTEITITAQAELNINSPTGHCEALPMQSVLYFKKQAMNY